MGRKRKSPNTLILLPCFTYVFLYNCFFLYEKETLLTIIFGNAWKNDQKSLHMTQGNCFPLCVGVGDI